MAGDLISGMGYYAGIGLANIVNTFNPEIIVIGGGLSNLGDLLIKPAKLEMERRAFAEPFDKVIMTRAELNEFSGVIGAAELALNRMSEIQL